MNSNNLKNVLMKVTVNTSIPYPSADVLRTAPFSFKIQLKCHNNPFEMFILPFSVFERFGLVRSSIEATDWDGKETNIHILYYTSVKIYMHSVNYKCTSPTCK